MPHEVECNGGCVWERCGSWIDSMGTFLRTKATVFYLFGCHSWIYHALIWLHVANGTCERIEPLPRWVSMWGVMGVGKIGWHWKEEAVHSKEEYCLATCTHSGFFYWISSLSTEVPVLNWVNSLCCNRLPFLPLPLLLLGEQLASLVSWAVLCCEAASRKHSDLMVSLALRHITLMCVQSPLSYRILWLFKICTKPCTVLTFQVQSMWFPSRA